MFSWINAIVGSVPGGVIQSEYRVRDDAIDAINNNQQQLANYHQGIYNHQIVQEKKPKVLTEEEVKLYNSFKDKACEKYYDDNAVLLFSEGYSKEDFIKNGMTYFNDHINAYVRWQEIYDNERKSDIINRSKMNLPLGKIAPYRNQFQQYYNGIAPQNFGKINKV